MDTAEKGNLMEREAGEREEGRGGGGERESAYFYFMLTTGN